MNKKVSTVAMLAAVALLSVGCANNSNNADKSSKSEKTSKVEKSSKMKSESKEDDTKTNDNEKLTPEEMANKISLTGTHKYSMRQPDPLNKGDDYLKFTVVDGKVTELVEIFNHDESYESDLKKEADLKRLNEMVERYKGSPSKHFEATLKDEGNDLYAFILKYKVGQNKMEDLFDDSILKDGKFDVRYMVQKYAEDNYVLQ